MTKAKRRGTLRAVLFNRIGKLFLLFWVEFKGWLKPKELLDLGLCETPADMAS
jgi:hypothetical protein